MSSPCIWVVRTEQIISLNQIKEFLASCISAARAIKLMLGIQISSNYDVFILLEVTLKRIGIQLIIARGAVIRHYSNLLRTSLYQYRDDVVYIRRYIRRRAVSRY